MFGRRFGRGYNRFGFERDYYRDEAVYPVAGVGRGRGGLGLGPCAYLIESSLKKSGQINTVDEKEYLEKQIELLKKDMELLQEKLRKIDKE